MRELWCPMSTQISLNSFSMDQILRGRLFLIIANPSRTLVAAKASEKVVSFLLVPSGGLQLQ